MSTATSLDVTCAAFAQRLEETLGAHRYQMWFDRSARFHYDDQANSLRIAVPNRFVADWISRHFDDDLRRIAGEEFGLGVALSVQIVPEAFITEAPTPQPVTVRPAAKPQKSNAETRNLRYRLDDFIVGPSNEMAFAAANQIVDDTAPHGTPLFVHGGCGLGKTHLLQGLCAKFIEQRPDAQVLYTTGEQFTNEFLAAMRANRIDVFRRRIRKLDLLAVDDVHFMADKQATQQEFLHSFDAIEMSGARVVMASDAHPKLIRRFSEALVSRCVRGLVVEVHKPDLTTRIRLIRALAQRRKLTLLEPAVAILANRIGGTVRDIEGMLTRLHALTHLDGRRGDQAGIGRALIDRLFEVAASESPRRPIRFANILQTVCEHMHMEPKAILGPSRNRNIVLARSMVIHLTRRMTTMSYPEIAQAMQRNNHSTIITAAKRIKEQIDDPTQHYAPPNHMQPIPLTDLEDQLFHAIQNAPQT